MNPEKAAFAQETRLRTLAEVIPGADLFLGLSGPGVLTGEMVKLMADKPIVFALANPNRRSTPTRREPPTEGDHRDGPVGLSGTRSTTCCASPSSSAAPRCRRDRDQRCDGDRLRGSGAHACRPRPRRRRPGQGERPSFGPDYLIPKPFDPRLLGDRRRRGGGGRDGERRGDPPAGDLDAWLGQAQPGYRSAYIMRRVRGGAGRQTGASSFAEGEDERVLRAVQSDAREGSGADAHRPAGRMELRCERRAAAEGRARFRRGQSVGRPALSGPWGSYHEVIRSAAGDAGSARAISAPIRRRSAR